MITQIFSIQNVEEALYCLDAGVDRIGVAVSTGADLPAELSVEQAKEIYDAIGNKAKKVMIVVADEPQPILEAAVKLKPDCIHVCGYNYYVDEDFVKKAKELLPQVEVMQAIGIESEANIEQALHFSNICDIIILDSVDKKINGIGVAGVTHDWSIDREIISKANCPVIIAGGLGPDNVAEAIKATRPWGVDSFTKTSDKLPDGKTKKNRQKILEFCENARTAFKELENG